MKKKLILIMLLLCSFKHYSQLNNSITLSGGIVQEDSFGGLINFNYNKNNSNYEIGVLHAMFKNNINSDINATFSNTSLQFGYLHTIVRSSSNSIFINIGLGATVGYDKIDTNDKLVITSENGPTAGLYGAGQLDFYVSDNFAFTLRAQHNYLLKSTTGDMNPYFGFGLKFNF